MNTPRILHIATLDMAIRFLLLDFLCYLQRQGFAVTAMSAPGPWVGEIEAAGIRHIPAGFRRAIRPWADVRALANVTRVLARERFDLVHTHTPKSLVLGQLAHRLARASRSVATLHGLYFRDTQPRLERRVFTELYRHSLKATDAIFCVSAEDSFRVERQGICPARKVVLIGQGTDTELFSPAVRERLRASARESLGLAPEAQVIGTVARLTPEKGLYELLEAARRVTARHPHARFLVIGPDYVLSRERLALQAQRMGVGERVQFLGMRTDTPSLYSAMDVFALPTYREGVPLALVEAAAMGLPVIATDIAACREVVDNGVSGRLVPARDAGALTEALEALLGDPDQRAALGAAARARAVNQFDRRRVWAIQEEHYRRLLGAPMPRCGVMSAEL